MPTVRTYGDLKVAPRGIPAGYKEGQRFGPPGPETFGAGLSEKVTQVALGLGSQIMTAQVKVRDEADQLAAQRAENEIYEYSDKLMNDPVSGARFQKGWNAMQVPEQVLGAYDQFANDVLGKLNARQRALAEPRFSAKRITLAHDAYVHTGTEMQAAATEERTRAIENYSNAAIMAGITLGARDPKSVASRVVPELAQAERVLRQQAIANGVQKPTGPDSEALTAALGALRTRVHAGVIDGMLATEGQEDVAEAYFQTIEAEIGADAAIRLKAKIEQQKSGKILADKALGLSQMYDGLSGTYADKKRAVDADIKDAKLHDAVLGYLKANDEVRDTQTRKNEESATDAGIKWLYAQGELADFDKMPQGLKNLIPPTAWNGMRATAAALRKKEEPAQDDQKYYAAIRQAGSVATREAFKQRNLNELRGYLDDQHWNRLIELQLQLRSADVTEQGKAKAKLDGYMTLTAAVEARLRHWKIDPDDKKNAPFVARIQSLVDRQAAIAAAANKQSVEDAVGSQDIIAMVDNVLRVEVTQPQGSIAWFLGFDPVQKNASNMVIGDLSKDTIAAIRRQYPNQVLSDEDVIVKYLELKMRAPGPAVTPPATSTGRPATVTLPK